MIQFSTPLPPGLPLCVDGHKPQLVESRGAPRGHRVGDPCPTQWHVECFQCQVATMPCRYEALALLRWRTQSDRYRIPLSQLVSARACVSTMPAKAA